jgi:hypothetical protein
MESNICSITTDGVLNMKGKKSGFDRILKESFPGNDFFCPLG